ncbi:MAG TPA: hypothetical protein VGI40_01040 [Pirellulaceae bacterium]
MSTHEPHLDSTPPETKAIRPSWRDLVDRPLVLLAVLFFVTAAPGLPLLWISRRFSLTSKIVWTILVLAWTALVLWGFYLVMAWCLPPIWEGIQILRG